MLEVADERGRKHIPWSRKMIAVLRAVGAIAAAIVVALVLVVAVELFSAVVHPLPPDFRGTSEEMCAHIERYPEWVLALVVPMWAGTAVASTWIAARLGNLACSLVVGLLFLAALISNISMLPYPLWFKIACLIAIATAIASVVFRTRRRGMAALNAAE